MFRKALNPSKPHNCESTAFGCFTNLDTLKEITFDFCFCEMHKVSNVGIKSLNYIIILGIVK